MNMMHTMSMADQLFVYQTNVIRSLATRGRVSLWVAAPTIFSGIAPTPSTSLSMPTWRTAPSVSSASTARPSRARKAPSTTRTASANIYYKHYTNRNWGEAQNYHLCLNSGLIGVDKCADIIVDVANMYE